MLSLGAGVSIFLAAGPIDLRRGHDGLITLVRSRWDAAPYSRDTRTAAGRTAQLPR